MIGTSDYAIIFVYFGFLIFVGLCFSRLSRSTSDFVRGGGKATWWLVGTSSLLSAISAFTFTGAAAAFYEAGPTMLLIYGANVVGYIIQAVYLAARFRQTRAFTSADILRERFGPEVEQFVSYYSVIFGVAMSAIPLWSLAAFCSAVFGLPEAVTIIGLGVVVSVYAALGGKWAVMGNDFVQSLLVFPITILLAWLCLREVGGFGGFVAIFSMPDISGSFALVKSTDSFDGGRFSGGWIVASCVTQILTFLNLQSASRYLSAKNGEHAGKAALLAGAGMAFGTLIWFIPPVVTRALWSSELAGLPMSDVENAAYAFAAIKLLPAGMIGLMVVAMFAATLSTMDVGLNNNAGIIVRNMLPAICRKLGRAPLSDSASLVVGRLMTLLMGAVTIVIAYRFAAIKGIKLVDAFFVVASVIGLPMMIPMVAGLFIKRLPRCSFFVIAGACFVVVLWSLVDGYLLERPWSYTQRILATVVAGGFATIFMIPFAARSARAYRERVEAFFAKMGHPVAPGEESEGNDSVQARLLGKVTLLLSGFVLALVLVPNSNEARIAFFVIAAGIALLGLMLLLVARRGTAETAAGVGGEPGAGRGRGGLVAK